METDLQIAQRRVRDAEAHVARQRMTLDRLKAGGHSTELALDLLKVFEDGLAQQRLALIRLQMDETFRAAPQR
ncbi:MAG: hypothetical protein ACOZAM_22120 [Pseudomonadota bacterium]